MYQVRIEEDNMYDNHLNIFVEVLHEKRHNKGLIVNKLLRCEIDAPKGVYLRSPSGIP
jgi:hypothetical protein